MKIKLDENLPARLALMRVCCSCGYANQARKPFAMRCPKLLERWPAGNPALWA